MSFNLVHTFQFYYTILILAIAIFVIAKEWLQAEVVFFGALITLIIGKTITVNEAFAGFSNQGMLTIGILFVVAGALYNTGALELFNVLLFSRGKSKGISRQILRISFPTAAASAFTNNTPLVAMMIPTVRSWAEKQDLAPSKFLIPASYAAILGGMCTLIGTSTTLVVHGLLIESGEPGFSFFEISKVGVPVALTGLIFLWIFGNRLLPDRKEPIVKLGENTREFVIGLKVTAAYKNIGKTIEEGKLRHLKGLFLFQIVRNGDVIAPAGPDERIREGDRLFFTGLPKTILELQRTPGLQLIKESSFDLKRYDSDRVKTYEAVVSPSSPLVGKNVRESNFRSTYGAVIIAIHRNGERIRKKIGDVVLHSGDTLLLLADHAFIKRWYHSNDFYLISNSEVVPSKPQWQMYYSIAVFLGMIVLAASGMLPLVVAAGLAALLLVMGRSISPAQIRHVVDWKVLIVIACAFGLAAAIQNSGLADMIAAGLVSMKQWFGTIGAITGVYVVTSLTNLIITSNATAALLFPVAISTAAATGLGFHPFAITLAIAAAASFATPISYQTNLMVYGPGGYKFKDYLKIGIPLQIVTAVIAIGMIDKLYL